MPHYKIVYTAEGCMYKYSTTGGNMAERRGANIEAIREPTRRAFLAQYVDMLQQLLELEFPTANGYEHSLEWGAAGCVDPRKHSQEIQIRCKAARMKVTKGRSWGIAITAGPADVAFKNVKVIVWPAVPFVEGVRRWILQMAAVLAGVIGLSTFGVALWQDPRRPGEAFHTGAILGGTIFLVMTFLGLSMLSPMRALLSTYRMGETIAASMGLINQGWGQMRQTFPGINPLTRKRSPAFFYLCWLIGTIALGGFSYWVWQSRDLPFGAVVGLAIIMAISAFAALGMLLGVIVSLLGLMKE
ncbi:MAG TPA: hypothetical protein VHA33_15460 [Candidatus Angelobacter sp.]|jgi:hypothetical protein|nr:hypothetical protein [Candidatus Angelobacter sp.]